jgi:NhaP-type Na+/H+ or K+/H+ antiporter
MAGSSPVGSIVLFIFLSLLLAIICREIKKKFKVPVTLSLLILGVIFRLAGPYLGMLGPLVHYIKGIDQTVFQFVVFPILIFEGAISMNWYTMRKELVQIIFLATTLVILNTLLTAVVLKYILQYNFSWYDLLLLGVVLSSTDHIAVDGILQELYIPERLETLISGETMCNEATVFVLFSVLLNSSSDVLSIAEKVGTFVRLSAGGLVLGLSFALAASLIIKRMLNDFILETNTLLVSAYLLYWVCEGTVLHVSGALALVAFGLYISAYGKTIISPEVTHRLEMFFELGARNVEAVTFIVAGILIADIAIFEADGLNLYDYCALFILLPFNYLVRAISLLVHYPLLKYTGYGFTWKELVTLTFAGIKGIISTTLALVIFSSDDLDDQKFQEIAAYFGIGTAGLTIAFGGLAMKTCIKLLGFEKMDDVQENMLVGVTKALVEASEEKIEELSREKDLKLVNWDKVIDIAGPRSLIESVLHSSEMGKILLLEYSQHEPKELLKTFSEKFTLSKLALKIEMRRRYLSTLKGIYWHFFRSGLCHGDTSLLLMDSCNISLDNETGVMKDWELVVQRIHNPKKMRYFSRFSKTPLLGRVFRKLLYKNIILAYDATQTFIKCHEETEELMDKIEIDIDKIVFEEIIKEAADQVEHAENFLKTYILDTYPEVLAEVQTKRSCKTLLYMQKKTVDKIYEHGLIKEVEYETLNESIEASIRRVTFQGFPTLPILRDILVNRFAAAEAEEIKFLISRIKEVKVEPGAFIFKEGEDAEGAFFIIRGRVNETSSWINQELIIGNIVGVQHLLEEFSKNYTSSAQAITYCILAQIPKDIITMQGFTADLYKEASEEILLLQRSKYGLGDIDEKYIMRIVSNSKIENFKKGKSTSFNEGALVLWGQPLEKTKAFLRPGNKIKEIIQDCVLLVLPNDFSLSYTRELSLGECFVKFCVKVHSVVRTGTKDLVAEDLNATDMRIEDTVLLTNPDDLKKPVSFKRRSVVPTKEGEIDMD